MRCFKYDVMKLIEGVRERPCLWDKTSENYKDRVERKMAWIQIFNILDERYREMSPENKRLTGEVVLTKWTNIRDTFVKSLRNLGKSRTKKYVLHDHLQFLTKCIAEKDGTDNEGEEIVVPVSFMKHENDNVRDEESNSYYTAILGYSNSKKSVATDDEVEVYEEPEELVKPRRKRAKKETITIEDDEEDTPLSFVGVEDSSDPRIMNEDEAFFASLLPSVVKYNEDERLEFRMEVLAVMKRIKDNRNLKERF